MKRLKIIIILVPLVSLLMLQSCKKGFLEGVNDSPNSPTSVSPNLLLPAAQAGLTYSLGGDVQRYTGLMTQYIVGADRQFSGYHTYNFTEEDFNNLWNNLYISTMKTIDGIRDIAEAEPGTYDGYDAIAQILMAYCLGLTTDLWNDIPYNEAFLGAENLKPAYQSQQEIYNTIQQLLTDAINTLESTAIDEDILPGADDYIYEGDLDAWVAFAHALKAKHYLHIVNVDGSAVASALAEINAGGPILPAAFPYSSTGPSPWFQYIEQRNDITYHDATVITVMTDREDPRIDVYLDEDHESLGEFFGGEGASVTLMTEFERKFIEAEIKLRSNDVSGAQAALTAALEENFAYYGVDGASYIATYGTLNSGTEMEQIITEKWIANYLSHESWTDWRRTGFPVLVPNNGVAIPTRFIYPTNERLYNNNGTNSSSNMFTPPMWWL